MKLKRKSAPKHAEVLHAEELSAERIHKNLLLAPDGLYAWFRMGAVPWAFRSAADRATHLYASTIRLADLAGHRVHVRRTMRPVPYSVWAKRLDKATPHPLETPGDPEAPTWQDMLVGSQQRIAELRMENPTTYIGVRVTTARVKPEDLEKITASAESTEARIVKARAALTKVTSAVTKEGFGATPVSSRMLGWLIHGSIGLGSAVSVASLAGPEDDWQQGDLDAFTAPVYAYSKPLDKTVTIQARRDGHEYTRHVAVLSMGRMPDRDTENPAFDPWLVHSDRLPFAVEWSWQFDVWDPATAAKSAKFYRERAEDNLEQYENHEETPPPAIGRGIRDAIRIEDETTEGEREVAVRLAGPIRCAVSAPTEAEVMEQVDALIDAYAMNQRISLVHTFGQYQMYREFIPGELASGVGFQRVMPAYYAATAVPNANTTLGDGEGPYIGYSGHRAVFFDPTWGPRNDMSGLILCQGTLGSGKSTAAGGALVEPFVRRGNQAVVFDPSGPLARLCDMPALRAHARHIELSGAEPGTLNPYWLVPEPTRDLYPSARDLEAARRESDAERRDLTVDALSMLLSERSPGYLAALETAVSSVGGEFGTNPWRVIHELEQSHDNIARAVGAQLRAVVPMKGARLIFPLDEHARATSAHGVGDSLLTVITMRGITTPPAGTERGDLTRAERMAIPVLHLAARYAMRAMYANQKPKLIVIDELGIVGAGGSSFRGFTLRGALDSRKCNTGFVLMGQNSDHILSLGPEVTNLVGAAFIGRMKGESAQRALSILDVPGQHGYERALQNLDTGEFLMRTWLGPVEKMKFDLDHRPDVLAHLDNTPSLDLAGDVEESSWTDELVTA